MKTCMVSIDVEEDLNETAKTFQGVEKLDSILSQFQKFNISATLFTTGEVLERYTDLILEWSKVHEIACHGYYHVPLYELSIPEREKQLDDFCQLYGKILGQQPKGFRAVQHTIDNAQIELLEKFGFVYDSSVVPRCVPFRNQTTCNGRAPTEPYHPCPNNCREKGDSKILEIPNSPLIFGIPLYGVWIRVLGPQCYKLLLMTKKPEFISLAVHPWDAVAYEGPFPRNSGDVFIKYLDDVLSVLSKSYQFTSGENIYRQSCQTT